MLITGGFNNFTSASGAEDSTTRIKLAPGRYQVGINWSVTELTPEGSPVNLADVWVSEASPNFGSLSLFYPGGLGAVVYSAVSNGQPSGGEDYTGGRFFLHVVEGFRCLSLHYLTHPESLTVGEYNFSVKIYIAKDESSFGV